MPKKILWFNWKDIKHPLAGGAEVVTHALCKALVSEGHEVTLVTAIYEGVSSHDVIDGVNIIRIGRNKYLHSFQANKYYIQNLKDKFDIIIEVVNTAPYLINYTKGKEKVFLFYHQLAREVWFFETKFPLNLIGFYLLEPIATFMQALFKPKTITISQSSKQDLMHFGFKDENVKIITEFIENKTLATLSDALPKEEIFTVLYHGSLRAMKRPIEVFKAFAILVKNQEKAQLWISGGGDQTEYKQFAKTYGFEERVTFFGRTSYAQKLELMQRASVLCATSVKEGWGLIVTEANSMGTPAIAYDVDGLRDSSASGGNFTVKPESEDLAIELEKLYKTFHENPDEYKQKSEEVLAKSKRNTVQQSYADFKAILGLK